MQEAQEPQNQDLSPAAEWDQDIARRALDELFRLAGEYRTTKDYRELLDFVGRFRFYSPYNAMLIYTQMPGAVYVAPPHRWLDQYHRRIKPGTRPLVILQPMGPVMFVYDVSDTEPDHDAAPLPPEIERPFETRGGGVGGEFWKTIENAKRDGIRVAKREAGSQDAGEIRVAEGEKYIAFEIKQRPEPEYVSVHVRYELLLNSKLSAAAQYATLVHELGHLYCGHLGTPNSKWWPNRRGLSHELREFEAESVCYLLCKRLNIDNPSAEYLSDYVKAHAQTPESSLELVIKSAGLIEQMGRDRLKPRKEKE
jgi:IrrE N-terminal-like domain